MAKTTIEYEASDIDLQNNKAHTAIFMGLLVGALTMSAGRRPGDPPPTKEETDLLGKKAVAGFLTLLEGSGYTIVAKEAPPSAFKDIFGSGL